MYVYEKVKPELFTDDGQRLFIRIRDRVKMLLAKAGAVRMQEAIAESTGSSWTMIACMDRMVELEEIREITQSTAGQYRVFIENR